MSTRLNSPLAFCRPWPPGLMWSAKVGWTLIKAKPVGLMLELSVSLVQARLNLSALANKKIYINHPHSNSN